MLPLHYAFTQGWEITPYVGGAEDIVEDANGHFFGTGAEAGQSLAFKLDETGQLLWKKTLPGRIGHSIDLLANGDLAIVGIIDEGTLMDTLESIFLVRLNANGDLHWQKEFNFRYEERVSKVFEDSQGQLWVSGGYWKEANSGFYNFILKLDNQGNILWKKDYPSPLSNEKEIAELPSGDFLMASLDNQTDLTKIDAQGNSLGNYSFNINATIVPLKIIPEGNGEVVVLADGYNQDLYYIKLNALGNVLASKKFEGFYIQGSNGGTRLIDGSYGIAGYKWQTETSQSDIFLVKLDAEGNKLWEKHYGTATGGISNNEYFGSVNGTSDGGFILTGGTGTQAYIVKTDASGHIYPNFVKGQLFHDENEDCLPNNGEAGLFNWLITAEGANGAFYDNTDQNGLYEINVPIGNYEINVIPINAYWTDACQNTFTVSFNSQADTIRLDLPVKPLVFCPIIEVNIATDRLRRCFPSTYGVQYCNNGTAVGSNIYIDLTFDEYIIVDSSDFSFTPLGNQVYRFTIGDIPIGECGQFQVHTTLSCDESIELGQVHCVEAHAFPDSLCLVPGSQWDGSHVDVSGYCESDTVFFKIENIGVGDMSSPLTYIVIEDQIILHEKVFQLKKGEYLIDTIVGMGSQYTLVAQQPEGSPNTPYPNVTIVRCSSATFNLLMEWPTNDGSPFIAVHCMENIGSYDPNDKQGTPVGWGEDKIVLPHTEINYMIRFQNTGTDVAYKVVIKDLLPPELDVKTIRPGVSSHPYTWSIDKSNRLVFTFDNILLPDSTSNLEASQGFVSFTIKQQPDLAIGTMIQNTAAIYFDFNEPIFTNQTTHRVGTLFTLNPTAVNELAQQRPQVKVYPNPFENFTIFSIAAAKPQAVQLRLFDLSGRLIRIESYENTTFQLNRKGLPEGLYSYQVILKDGTILKGKLVVLKG